ncbi:hypothetical protein E4A44_29390 [Escherichia coli]|nr:hypothetical protein [Escherichia coli]
MSDNTTLPEFLQFLDPAASTFFRETGVNLVSYIEEMITAKHDSRLAVLEDKFKLTLDIALGLPEDDDVLVGPDGSRMIPEIVPDSTDPRQQAVYDAWIDLDTAVAQMYDEITERIFWDAVSLGMNIAQWVSNKAAPAGKKQKPPRRH